MSVESNTYVLLGVKLPFEHFNEEQRDQFEPYWDSAFKGIQHHNGLCVVDDGMSGKYYFVGRVLAKSIDERSEGIPITDCTVTATLVAEVAGLLEQHFDLAGPDVRVWAFTHYR